MDTEIKHFVNKKLNYKKSPVILEIGSHYCEDTVDMINVFSNPIIHCFEPDPRNISVIRKYMNMLGNKAYKHGSNVFLHTVALYEENGEKDFYLSYRPMNENDKVPQKYIWINEDDYRSFGINDSGSSSLKYGSSHVRDAKIIKVKTKRLDDWAKENEVYSADFIWMDVQGAEKEVINGGMDFFRRSSWVWMEYGEIEYQGAMDKNQTIRTMENLGFSFVLKRDNNILFKKI
jgi:FkbM family methyltransferase